jgi:hypothetical protein
MSFMEKFQSAAKKVSTVDPIHLACSLREAFLSTHQCFLALLYPGWHSGHSFQSRCSHDG